MAVELIERVVYTEAGVELRRGLVPDTIPNRKADLLA